MSGTVGTLKLQQWQMHRNNNSNNHGRQSNVAEDVVTVEAAVVVVDVVQPLSKPCSSNNHA